ncbi:MAG: hypothetical protein QOF77_667 [Solirubrobacteraceae bacterium]|jgi:hypothetical protein|nr:hypothetical protein [Solirubrobacteraceae bacterium]
MSRCSRRTVGAALSCLAAALGAAPAARADSSPLLTGHPGLTAAQAISPKQVLACFDHILSTPFNFTDAGFFLQGYREDRRTGPGGLVLSSETSVGGGFCVVASFTGPGDARTFSRLVVLANAVNAAVPGGGGAGNTQGASPLLGSTLPNTPGGTLRPQLIAAAPGGPTEVTYTFDEPLTAAAGTASFGFYTSADTSFHAGTVSNFAAGTTVAVDFSAADAAVLAQATRFVVAEGAVTDAGAQTNPVGAIGAATQRLDVAPTTGPVAGALAYRFDFTQAIPNTAVVCPAKFALVDVTGVRYSPAAGSTPAVSGASVTLSFAPDSPGGDPAQITLATVAAGALNGCAAGTAAPLNSEGTVGLQGATAAAGATTGPDLVSFQVNRSTGFVSFVFDAPVSSAAASLLAARFHLVDQSANLTAPPNQGGNGLGLPVLPPELNVGPANQVNVNFSVPTTGLLGLLPGPPDLTAVRNAVGVSVDEGAVADSASGVVNPLGSFGVTPAPTPPVATVPTTTTTPPATVPTTPTTAKKPVTTTACRRVVTLHLLSSVSRNLSSVTVTVNGKKVTVSKKLTVTIAFAKYKSVKSIVVKIKGKLKNHHSITRTKTYKNKC